MLATFSWASSILYCTELYSKVLLETVNLGRSGRYCVQSQDYSVQCLWCCWRQERGCVTRCLVGAAAVQVVNTAVRIVNFYFLNLDAASQCGGEDCEIMQASGDIWNGPTRFVCGAETKNGSPSRADSAADRYGATTVFTSWAYTALHISSDWRADHNYTTNYS